MEITTMSARLFVATLACSVPPCAALLTSASAFGHDWSKPQLDPWYNSLRRPHVRSPAQTSCCSVLDCHTTEAERRGNDWWARLGLPDVINGKRQWILGPWVKVPDDIIVRDTPNAAGEPVLCHSFVNTAGNISVEGSVLFCFVPPPES